MSNAPRHRAEPVVPTLEKLDLLAPPAPVSAVAANAALHPSK